jgi:hypothetical protein
MTVDFRFARAPEFRVATVTWSGPWNERRIQKEFEGLAQWAARRKVKTGKWIFMEAPSMRRWTAAIEVRGSAKGHGKVRMRRLPATAVVAVKFDPEAVSARLVYHGLSDWLRWRRKEKEIKRVVSSREVYEGNPWRDPKVWARTEVQFVVVR